MKLAEDQQVIEALKQILKNYDYLEYDETWSVLDELRIKVIDLNAKRNLQVIAEIHRRLQGTTNRKFSYLHGGQYTDTDNFNEVWTDFTFTEKNTKREHTSVRTYVCKKKAR
ncbi:hypothetical protein F4X73_02275 [Candidatus Poribacteria bacterium]|nr:hypothetical protein [Candidatus Poribacteria bacterium]